jgi:tetratricopeptide (TPR) repeat protein
MLYSAMADHSHAIAAFEEALAVYRRLGNEERSALTLLNIGMAYHLADRRREAIAVYRDCLARCAPLDLRLIMVRAHYNLAEACAELGELAEAARYFAEGRQIASDSAFDDELRDLEALSERFPALREPSNAPPKLPPQPGPPPAATAASDPAEQAALALIARDGAVTAKALMAATGVSKATATRRLADMAARGLLVQQGQGRSTAYVLAQAQDGGRRMVDGGSVLLGEAQLAALREEFSLMGIAPIAAGDGPALRLLVRFARLPDLRAFFALERRLSAMLGQPVDLVLEEE